MFVARYSRTMAGAQRLAEQRRPVTPTVEAPRQEAAPAAPPVAENVLPFPRDTIQKLIAAAAAAHDVPVSAIMSKSRKEKALAARFDAIAAVKRHRPCMSLGQIGRIFNKDHTSIHNALRQRGMA